MSAPDIRYKADIVIKIPEDGISEENSIVDIKGAPGAVLSTLFTIYADIAKRELHLTLEDVTELTNKHLKDFYKIDKIE